MTFVFRIFAIAFMLAVGVVGTRAANAAPIPFSIQFLESGSVIGSGSFSIDDALFDNVGSDTYSPTTGLLSLDFTINGISFDITDDFGYDLFPEISFLDGMFAGFNFNGESEGATLIALNTGFEFIDAAGDSTTGSIVAVPEPSTLLVLSAGLIALGGLVRRSTAG